MAKIRFFPPGWTPTLSEIAALTGAGLAPGADPDRVVADVAPLDSAGPDDLTFLDNSKYVGQFETTRAGAAFVSAR